MKEPSNEEVLAELRRVLGLGIDKELADHPPSNAPALLKAIFDKPEVKAVFLRVSQMHEQVYKELQAWGRTELNGDSPHFLDGQALYYVHRAAKLFAARTLHTCIHAAEETSPEKLRDEARAFAGLLFRAIETELDEMTSGFDKFLKEEESEGVFRADT